MSYIESVQPSLVSNEIINAEIQEIGTVSKITLMEKRNNETLRVVVMSDSKTNKMKLIDESIIKPIKPTKLVIEKTK